MTENLRISPEYKTAFPATYYRFEEDTELNARCDSERDLFDVAQNVEKPQPSADEITANKKKHGLDG